MPFAVYGKYEEIPEALGRDNFRQGADNKWYAQLTEDHPLVKKKQELLTTNATLTGENTQLKEKAVPSGHRIIPVADFTLLEVIKQMGISSDEIKTRLTDYPALKEKETAAVREKSYEDAGKFLKYTNLDAFKTTLKLLNVDVTFKPEKVDNVDVQVPYVGDKRLADHITATPELKTMEPFFKTAATTPAPRTEAGSGSRPSTGTPPSTTPPATETGKEQPKDNFRFNTPGDVAWE
jgi:uncharacterized protein YfkK (UPF0435 family)